MIRRLIPAAALLTMALVVPGTASATATAGATEAAIVVISGDVDVARGQVVEGVFVANGDTTIAGEVAGDVIVLSGDVIVSGRIDGDLFTAGGTARLLPSAEVTGDVEYGDEHPAIALDARVHGDVSKQDLARGRRPLLRDHPVPDLARGHALAARLRRPAAADRAPRRRLAPRPLARAARPDDRDRRRDRDRAAGGRLLAAITIVGLPLAIGIGLALLPLGTVAYLVSAYALGRRMVEPPRHRMLSFLAGLGALRVAAYVPILGTVVGVAALFFGLGLIGAAIGAAREPDPDPPPAPQIPGS